MRETPLDSMQRESLEMMVMSGDLLMAVVNDCLDYSKLESGNVDIDISRTNLQEMLDSVVWPMQTKARNRDIAVDTTYDVSLPLTMQTDSRRVQQVLYNLLGNAVKFSKENAVVQLVVTVVSNDSRHDTESHTAYSPPPAEGVSPPVTTANSDRTIRFVVRDSGKGIDPSMFAKIFHPFAQESSDTETLYGGSGLGLAISSKLVHRLGGTISVDSQVGKWTEFAVELPLQGCDPAPFDLELLRTAKVWVVDPDPLEQDNARRVFDYFAIEHHVASSLPTFPKSGKEAKLSVVIIQEDLWRPDMQLPPKSVIITTGTNYTIKTAHGHIRSLRQTVPNNILFCIAESIKIANSSQHEKVEVEVHTVAVENNEISLTSLKIMIAEDNKINQRVLVRILERIGISDVKVAVNGQEAVDFAMSGVDYDVILMDMQMPGKLFFVF